MSCNGCRILRKGCSDTCILRPCLQWIDTPEAQGNATVFVAKFFGRAGLMSFISAVPPAQRPALFQSLLFEAAGRTVNPVNGAVGLLWGGNWHVCQEAVETVFRGGTLQPIPELLERSPEDEIASDFPSSDVLKLQKGFPSISSPTARSSSSGEKRRRLPAADLDLSLTTTRFRVKSETEQWVGSPDMNSEESGTTHWSEEDQSGRNLLNLFN